jgi:Ca2+-binding RTX toxin-like protein
MPSNLTNFWGSDLYYSYYFPDLNTPFDGLDSSTVITVGPSIEITDLYDFNDDSGDDWGNYQFIDITANQIIVDFGIFVDWTPAQFNGFVITDYLDQISSITNVTVSQASFLTTFDVANVSFSADSIYVNWAGMSVDSSSRLVLDVTFAPATPPSGTSSSDAILAGSFLARAVYGEGSIHQNFWGTYTGTSDPYHYDDDYRGYISSQSTATETWTLLAEAELGASFFSTPGAGDFTAGGLFRSATGWLDTNAGEALCALRTENGNTTLCLTFRGSDGLDAFLDGQTFDEVGLYNYYMGMRPIILAAANYAQTHNIQDIVVSGHSLGGTIVDLFALADSDLFSGRNLSLVSIASAGLERDISIYRTILDLDLTNSTLNLFGVLTSVGLPADVTNYYAINHSEDRVYYSTQSSLIGLTPNLALYPNLHFGNVIDIDLPNIGNLDVVYPDRNFLQYPHGFGAEHNADLYWANVQELMRDSLFASYTGQNIIMGISDYSRVLDYDGSPISLFSGYTGLGAFGVDNDQGTRSLAGTAGDDYILGMTGNDYLIGFNGNDLLSGGEGNDTFHGGAGSDTLAGGTGDDSLLGGSWGDLLGGEGGNDLVDGQDGHDQLYGSWGSDTLLGGDGNDSLYGGSWGDLLGGEGGNDLVYGQDGQDRLYGSWGSDTLLGGNGNDSLYGGTWGDVLGGDAGNDLLGGDGGHDQLYGGSGNDRLYGGGGNDSLYGGTGQDLLVGGVGNDDFIFRSAAEVGIGGARDVISDFTAGQDQMDFTAMGMTFSAGSSFTNTAGEMIAVANGGDSILTGDVNGDGVADFELMLLGVTSVTAGMFV